MEYFWLVAGAVLIIWGASRLTDGAAAMAKRFCVSEMVIGLTVVAFGTSMPEFTVSVVAALRGSSDMAVGNVIGSNIFNSLMIVGCTALVAPICITRRTVQSDIPFGILAAAVLFCMGGTMFLDGTSESIITRSDGLVLLCFFAIFMAYTFAIAGDKQDCACGEAKAMPLWRCIAIVAIGLAAMTFGGRIFVDGASGIARAWGVSESTIALTIVACGTSLPEFAASLVAAYHRKPDLAIGNVIGSNLFNIFFVLGTGAVIKPLPLGDITVADLGMLVAASIALWIVSVGDYRIRRWEGALLAIMFCGYLVWLILHT